MPDNSPADSTDSSAIVRALLVIERIAKLVVPLIGAALAGWAVHVGQNNNTQGAVIVQQGETIVQKQVEVKTDLDKDAKKNARANEIKLYEAWKNLDWLATDSGLKKDADKAAEAKRVLDEFVAHKNGS